MSLRRMIAAHTIALAASGAFAIVMWTKDPAPNAALGDVTVWAGRAKNISRIFYESKTKKVVLEAREDENGRFFLGTMTRKKQPKQAPDAGPPPEEPAEEETSVSFLSVTVGNNVAGAFGPLRALRAFGKLTGDKLEEFGLDEPSATLTVTLDGKEHTLEIGDTAVGGADKYVLDTASGEAYVLHGEALKNLENGDTGLSEKDLHEWKPEEPTKARVVQGGRKRDLVRAEIGGKKVWAAADAPDRNDETLGNWMAKVDRLRAGKFSDVAEGAELIVRIEYQGPRGEIGWLELSRGAGVEEGKSSYWLRTERIRIATEVPASMASQIEADVGSVLP